MPRVTCEAEGVIVHCTLSQVPEVLARLRSTTAGSADSQSIPGRAVAALAIKQFVNESHLLFGEAFTAPVDDLRHGVNLLRRRIFQAQLDKPARNEALAICKRLDRLHVADSECRHYSQGSLVATASRSFALLSKFGDKAIPKVRLQSEGAAPTTVDAVVAEAVCPHGNFSIASDVGSDCATSTSDRGSLLGEWGLSQSSLAPRRYRWKHRTSRCLKHEFRCPRTLQLLTSRLLRLTPLSPPLPCRLRV